MIIEFYLVSYESASHRKDVDLLHLSLYFCHVAHPALLDGQVDISTLGQLHPESLELFTVTVTGCRKLHVWGGSNTSHTNAHKAIHRVAGRTTKHVIKGVHGLHGLCLWRWLSRRQDGSAQQVINTLLCCRLIGVLDWGSHAKQVVNGGGLNCRLGSWCTKTDQVLNGLSWV